MTRPPHEPTAPVKPVTRGRGDTPPPAPPHELKHAAPDDRTFEHEGRAWIARSGGKSACGTGSYGLGMLEAVHFYHAGAMDRPVREALVPFGCLAELFDEELIRLLAGARPVEPPA